MAWHGCVDARRCRKRRRWRSLGLARSAYVYGFFALLGRVGHCTDRVERVSELE
jgi:hypothetical protein